MFSGGYYALIILRILMGLAEGVAYPALTVFLAAWIPERERSVLGSIVFSGGQVKECQLPKIVINPIYHFFSGWNPFINLRVWIDTLLSVMVSCFLFLECGFDDLVYCIRMILKC